MKNSPYHKTVSSMTTSEEVAEIVGHIADILRPATPEVRKGVLNAIKRGVLDEVELK